MIIVKTYFKKFMKKVKIYLNRNCYDKEEKFEQNKTESFKTKKIQDQNHLTIFHKKITTLSVGSTFLRNPRIQAQILSLQRKYVNFDPKTM